MNTAPECVDMTESLRRGAGRLLYNGDEGSLVLSTDGTFLLSDIQDGALLCEKIRTLCPAAPKLFTVKSDDAAAALMREFSCTIPCAARSGSMKGRAALPRHGGHPPADAGARGAGRVRLSRRRRCVHP